MTIPTINPLRFYSNNGTKNENNLSFEQLCEYRNISGKFQQSFLDKAESIYYKPLVSGMYGLNSLSDFNTFNSESIIYYNEAKLKGLNEIDLINTNGKKIVIKAESDGVVTIAVTGATVTHYNQSKQFKKNEPIIIDGVNETTTITLLTNGTNTLTLYGYAICDIGDDYLINQTTKTSELIDISQYGAVYLMSTQSKTSYLPSPTLSDEYSDVIRKYTIDLNPAYDDRENLKLEFGTIILAFKNNATFTNLPTDFKERLRQCYDWISFEDNDTYVTVEVAHYELTAVAQSPTGGSSTDYPVTYVSQRNDEFNWYLADGITDDFINIGTSYIQDINGVIRAKNETNFSVYRDYTPNIEVMNGAITESFSIASFPATAEIENGAHFSFGADNYEIVVISKTAFNRIYGTCNQMEIGIYNSEPFEVLRLEESYAKKMQNLTYQNSYETKGMALDVFQGGLLLPSYIDIAGEEDVQVFNGQEASFIIGAEDVKINAIKSNLAIPNYLIRIIQVIFTFDILKVNGIDITAVETMSKDPLDNTLKYHFEQKIRENNYGYTI